MSNSPSILPVLVVGAGPTGLAAALTLAQNGVPVRIIDKEEAFHTTSRGAGIHPRSVEVFHFLGVLNDARKFHRDMPPFQSYKLPGGTEVLKTWHLFDKFESSPDRPWNAMMISQYYTEGVFRDHLAKHGIHVELRTEPVSMEQDDEGVSVTLKRVDGDGKEQTESVRAAYVVGADGARGITRKLIGATFEGQTQDADGSVYADAVIEGLSSEFWHMWSDLEKMTIAARPKLEPNAFYVAVFAKNFDPVDLVDEQKFVDFFHQTTGREDLQFKEITALTYWKPKMRMVDKLQKGRIFIAGDAAHIHSPSGGQGLNTSVQDSFNLAWKLALVYKGLASPDLLGTYQVERLPVIAQMLTTTSNLYNQLTPKKEDSQATTVQDPKKAGLVEWRGSTALYQLDINYRWSPITVDAHGKDGLSEDDLKARAYEGYPGGDVRAGDRAPQAPALVGADGLEKTLFDLFKPTFHTVLVFSPQGGAAEIVKAAQEYPAGTVHTVVLGKDAVPQPIDSAESYHDKEGHAYRAYHVDGGEVTVVVVRPDGYVGAVVHDVSGLRTYFAKIFRVL
ncbi:FAD binding domain-containing protein [Dichomitus squalens]|uniref:FAD binding domain-containing protein n=1 Tax=Dichomitus squalens TaxID=114155 RepID=A0A4Q9MQL9_9APHY|nr:FAD binding domain-containing protein [Dichomitus squalens]